MTQLLSQIKQRRLALGLKQADMHMRVGISRQQYQYIESKGNPRLNTLELVAMGLNTQLMLIPKEKLAQVKAILNEQADTTDNDNKHTQTSQDIVNNPWQGILEDLE